MAFAKTTRPAISAIVPRERLFLRLDGTPGRTVAWISGPPGAGKTSLAASYLEARGHRVLWYQVDPDDADVASFFHYLGHAARKLDAARGPALPALNPAPGTDLASFSRKFFRQLFARAKGPLGLVLDNLHQVPPESPLQQVIEAAFTQVPKHCVVVVTSRSEPPASLARMRVTGEMACVGAESLELEPPELVEMAKMRGHALAPDAASELHARTQGWVAGAVLMLEHAKLSGRIAELPGGSAPRAIFDYLAGEIFDRFEAKTRQFLLRIACLPRMTAGVAEALSGEPKAARLLLNLALNDYFVKELQSEDGRVYQLHPLLRGFLRSRAAQELPEALSPAELRRAAGLLRAAGQVDDAVSLLIESESWEEVARIAGDEAQAMLAQGRRETLGRWLDLLSAAHLEADPRLLYALGACRSEASPRSARRLFERAFEAFRAQGAGEGMLASACGVVDAVILEFDDLAPLDAWIVTLGQLLGESTQKAAVAPACTLLRAMLLRDPASPQVATWLGRAAAGARDDAPAEAELALLRASAAMLRGELHGAGAAIAQLGPGLRSLPAAAAAAHGIAASLHSLLAGAHRSAVDAARSALAAAEAEGMHAYDGWLRAAAVAGLLGEGERDAARGELHQLEAGAAGLRRGDRAVMSYLRGWLGVLEGDAALALREARAGAALAMETGIPALECLSRVALGQLLCEAGDRRGAEAQLRAAMALAERLGSHLLRFAAQLAVAAAAADEGAAATALAAAFRLGAEHDLDYAPCWRRGAMAELCALALRRGIEPEYARRLIRARALVPAQPPLRVAGWPWAYSIRMLGGAQIMRGGAAVEFAGKGPGRPMELLKVLVALGGQNVRADQLADALWPHVDSDYAHKSFTATLHRLRRLLGDEDALLLRDARLSLNPALVWVDAWALEQVLAELDDSLRAPHSPDDVRRLTDEAFALYKGPFLPDEAEQPAYIAFREQLRARLLRCLARLARGWEEGGRGDAAADCYLRCIEVDPLFEAPYRNLMLCYQRMGEAGEARGVFERLRTVLLTRMKTAPGPETQAVFESLTAKAR